MASNSAANRVQVIVQRESSFSEPTINHSTLQVKNHSSTNTTKAITITSAHKVLHNNKRKIPLGRRRR
jgi:hypothetical protein